MLTPEQNNERKNHLRPLAPKPIINPFLTTSGFMGLPTGANATEFQQNRNLFTNFAFPTTTQQWLSLRFATTLLLQQQQQQQQQQQLLFLLLKYPGLLNLQQQQLQQQLQLLLQQQQQQQQSSSDSTETEIENETETENEIESRQKLKNSYLFTNNDLVTKASSNAISEPILNTTISSSSSSSSTTLQTTTESEESTETKITNETRSSLLFPFTKQTLSSSSTKISALPSSTLPSLSPSTLLTSSLSASSLPTSALPTSTLPLLPNDSSLLSSKDLFQLTSSLSSSAIANLAPLLSNTFGHSLIDNTLISGQGTPTLNSNELSSSMESINNNNPIATTTTPLDQNNIDSTQSEVLDSTMTSTKLASLQSTKTATSSTTTIPSTYLQNIISSMTSSPTSTSSSSSSSTTSALLSSSTLNSIVPILSSSTVHSAPSTIALSSSSVHSAPSTVALSSSTVHSAPSTVALASSTPSTVAPAIIPILPSTTSSISTTSLPTSTTTTVTPILPKEDRSSYKPTLPFSLSKSYVPPATTKSFTETSILASGTVQSSSSTSSSSTSSSSLSSPTSTSEAALNIFPKYNEYYTKTLLKEKENYMKLSVQELKTRLKQKRKKVCGKKEVLVERLIMSNLDEINTKIKNELLYKLNIIQPEPKPKPEKNIPTHSKASSTGKIKYNKMPILVSTTTTTTTTTPKLTTPKLATTTTTATATTTIAAKTATITGTSTASTVGINTTPIIKPHLSIPKVNSVSLSKSLATLASKISSRSAKSTTVTNSNFINIPTQLSSLSSAVPTETTSFINQAVSKVNPANELEINNAINKSSFPTLPEEEEEDTFVASRTLPIADVLKNIRGSESTSIHSITEQYYRLKRKFEYQEILKAQHHLHHPISQIHPILKKLKYN